MGQRLAGGVRIGIVAAAFSVLSVGASWAQGGVTAGPLIVASHTFGTFDSACVAGFIANERGVGANRCQVEGYSPGLASYAGYDSVDSVALYASNTAPPPDLTLSGVRYTSPTRITLSQPLTPGQVALLRVGQHVSTGSNPVLRSQIASWDPEGRFIDINQGWARPGDDRPGQIPAGVQADTVFVNKIERVWALNANVLLVPGGAQSGVGFELGMVNANRAPPETTWGYDSINMGCGSEPFTHPECMAGSAFIARGDWQVAYRAQSGRQAAFMVDQSTRTANGIGFLSLSPVAAGTEDQLAHDFAQFAPPPAATPRFRVANTGRVYTTGVVIQPRQPAAPGGTSIQLNAVAPDGSPRQAYVDVEPAGTLQLLAPQASIVAASDMVARGSLAVRGPLVLSGPVPSTSGAACTAGELSVNASYVYVCVADHHWKRSALSDF